VIDKHSVGVCGMREIILIDKLIEKIRNFIPTWKELLICAKIKKVGMLFPTAHLRQIYLRKHFTITT
jgi:hypothetical protein